MNTKVVGNSINTLNSVMIPILRRVMPTIIANDIIGVSPMTRPTSLIYSLRQRYNDITRRIKITKEQYKYFLRLNDRKKSQREIDFINAKYPSVNFRNYKLTDKIDIFSLTEWCNAQFSCGGYVISGYTIWFSTDYDAMLFKLRWSDGN